jgi:phosphomannomutase
MASPIVFGTDGWRAVIAREYTFGNVRRVSDALGRVLKKGAKVAVGYDHRFLSEEFARHAAATLASLGHHGVLTGAACSTPALSFTVRKLKADCGVMITASHNPALYNGFKVKLPPGCSADPEFTRRIEEKVDADVPPFQEKLAPAPSYDPAKDYVAFLLSKLDRKFWRSPKIRLAADGMHGPGGTYWGLIFKALGLKGTVIRAGREPLFGGVAPEPVEKNLDALKKAVLENKAGLGLAVDGDADRLGAMDDKGEYLPPHQVFPLILTHLVKNRRMTGKVVQTVSLGYLSERIAKAHKLALIEVPVGFKHVADHIRKEKVLWGGEESGGYGAGLFQPERDGLLSGLLLMEYVLAEGKPLSVLREEMEKQYGASRFAREDYPMRLPVADKKRWADHLIKHLPAKLAGTPVKETRTLDGLKIILEDDSWLLLRPSGTEPLMRTYAESPDAQKTRQLLAKAQEMVNMKPPPDPAAPKEPKKGKGKPKVDKLLSPEG